MIIRILGDAQYEVDESDIDRLTALDAIVESALDAGDDQRFHSALSDLIAEVRRAGRALDAATITPSDLVLPNEDADLHEVRDLLASEEVES